MRSAPSTPRRTRRRLHRACVESLEQRQLLANAHFAVIGDFGQAGSNEAAVASLVKSWNPEFIVTVGDNSYPTAAAAYIDANIGQYYHEYIYNYTGSYGAGSPTRRFFPALGNHDWGNVVPGNASSYLSYFDLPASSSGNERYYDFVQGPVHFFVVDSDGSEADGNTATSVQGQWLQAQLAAASEPHKVVLFHHPAYSSGSAHGSTLNMRWPFAQWGATAVISGHEHIYERLNKEGIVYFVNGLGGAGIHSVGTPIAGSQFTYNSNYGAMLVDASDSQMQFKFYNRLGTLIDEYTLVLGPTAPLVSAGTNWHYLDNGSNQGTAWRNPSFVESGWSSGNAKLGYGDADVVTTVGFGPNSSARYITTYFRKVFSVANPAAITALELGVRRDDGAVVYLNGTEVFRTNMPGGTIGHTTLASSAVSGTNENTFYSTTVNPALLVAGNNLLAVELHQSGGTSSDLGFDLSLVATGDFTAPGITSSAFNYIQGPMSVRFTFDSDVHASLGAADLVLNNLTTSTTIATNIIQMQWIDATRTAVFTFSTLPNGGALPDGRYNARIVAAGVTNAIGNPLAADYDLPFYFLNGDANHDAVVDIADLTAVGAHWLMSSGMNYATGDFNRDGVVNSADLGILAVRWQSRLPPAPSAPPVPSPAVASPQVISERRAAPSQRLVHRVMR